MYHQRIIHQNSTNSDVMNHSIQSALDDYRLNIGLIKISGEDSLSFLQGQLSNDINELHSNSEKTSLEKYSPKNKWHYSGYCNQKGRLITLLKIWCEKDGVYALMSKDLVESTTDRLRKYVMRSKVVIDVIETAQCFGISSLADLESITQSMLAEHDTDLANTLKDNPQAIYSSNLHSVLKIGSRYLLVDKSASLDTTDSNKLFDSAAWIAEEINSGHPEVNHGSSELFIPQMLNLDVLGGINFKKGCYTGQEIVARMHYLGKLKQRMFVCELIEGDASALPTGSNIYSDADLSKSVGTVVSSITNSDKLLAVLRLSEMKNSLYTDSNAVIKVASQQPYEIPLTADTQPS